MSPISSRGAYSPREGVDGFTRRRCTCVSVWNSSGLHSTRNAVLTSAVPVPLSILLPACLSQRVRRASSTLKHGRRCRQHGNRRRQYRDRPTTPNTQHRSRSCTPVLVDRPRPALACSDGLHGFRSKAIAELPRPALQQSGDESTKGSLVALREKRATETSKGTERPKTAAHSRACCIPHQLHSIPYGESDADDEWPPVVPTTPRIHE